MQTRFMALVRGINLVFFRPSYKIILRTGQNIIRIKNKNEINAQNLIVSSHFFNVFPLKRTVYLKNKRSFNQQPREIKNVTRFIIIMNLQITKIHLRRVSPFLNSNPALLLRLRSFQ